MGQGIERREFFKKAGAFLFAIQEIVSSLPDSFPWTREEILFGPNAGFEEARAGIPLGIWANPALTRIDLPQIILPWNVMANRLGRSDLFYSEEDPDQARIHFMPDIRNHMIADPDYISPYKLATVYLINYNNPTVGSHELGHTLGFVDFISKGSSKDQKVNPQICDSKGKQIRTIMTYSYCDWQVQPDWFGEDDENLLRVAGYA